MKTAAIRKLRLKLAADTAVYGVWVTLADPSVTEMAVALGVDWVVIDAEHGQLDWSDIVGHLRAAVRSDTVALVRIAELNGGLIKRALDLGADGVVIPWVESPQQLTHAVSLSRYPPDGLRGMGAERATGWGQCLQEHVAEANEHVLVVPIIETVRAFDELPAMIQVEGADIFFFGPADYSASAGYPGQWEGPGVAEQIASMKDAIRQAGKQCGVLATGNDDLLRRREQGFRMLGLGLDAGLFLRALHGALSTVGRDRAMHASLEAAGEPPLPRPPESMRPDRREVMNAVGARATVEIAPGVNFDCLVGAHNGARSLTTGIVAFAAGAELPYHLHEFSESITLLEGRAEVEVEGRLYRLGPLDNVVVPRGTAHAARAIRDEPAVFHIAMATSNPTRTLVEPYPARVMPDTEFGTKERVNRIRYARHGTAGHNTEFVDFFNSDLVPGIEMSGGYALFHPGGRLPAHVHDFDESICIMDGEAVCVVEGRRYPLRDAGTALVPRGRVHYFRNDTELPMAMIWVYAGPLPLRIVVDEACATVEGAPWGGQ